MNELVIVALLFVFSCLGTIHLFRRIKYLKSEDGARKYNELEIKQAIGFIYFSLFFSIPLTFLFAYKLAVSLV